MQYFCTSFIRPHIHCMFLNFSTVCVRVWRGCSLQICITNVLYVVWHWKDYYCIALCIDSCTAVCTCRALNDKSCDVVFQTPRKKKTRHSSNPPVESHVGWVMDAREHRPSRSQNNSMSQRYICLKYKYQTSRISLWIIQKSVSKSISLFLCLGCRGLSIKV